MSLKKNTTMTHTRVQPPVFTGEAHDWPLFRRFAGSSSATRRSPSCSLRGAACETVLCVSQMLENECCLFLKERSYSNAYVRITIRDFNRQM